MSNVFQTLIELDWVPYATSHRKAIDVVPAGLLQIAVHVIQGSRHPHYSLLEASMSMVRPETPEHLDDAMREYATNIVENAKQFAAEQGARDVRGFVKSGPPARTIVAFAKNRHVDLIVLGSRGLGDVEQFLLGSVSHKVVSLAECPTLVV